MKQKVYPLGLLIAISLVAGSVIASYAFMDDYDFYVFGDIPNYVDKAPWSQSMGLSENDIVYVKCTWTGYYTNPPWESFHVGLYDWGEDEFVAEEWPVYNSFVEVTAPSDGIFSVAVQNNCELSFYIWGIWYE